MRTERIEIRGGSIRLCDLLKFAGTGVTGGEAKNAVARGMVAVNGAVCLIKGKQIRPGDKVVFGDVSIEVTGGAG